MPGLILLISPPARPHTQRTWGKTWATHRWSRPGDLEREHLQTFLVDPVLHFVSLTAPRAPWGVGGCRARLGSAPLLPAVRGHLVSLRKAAAPPPAVRSPGESPRWGPTLKPQGTAQARAGYQGASSELV